MKSLTALLVLLLTTSLHAHPVSYQGSKGIMGYHSPIVSHNQINYSFKHWFAAGVHHIRRPTLDNKYGNFASTNFLLKRWNGERLQANIYANIGLGHSKLGDTSKAAGLGLIQFDIEDRDYYFLAKHLQIYNDNRSDFAQTIVRAGISPYVVNYNGIHSWLILELQNADFNGSRDVTDLTPFIRIFYKNFLFEIGQSFDGISKFNYIAHF